MGLPALPIAPVRGVVWVAEKLNDAAERELHDPGVLRAQLALLNRELEDGDISLEEFEREEERLLARLHAAEVGPRAERSKVTRSWMTQPR
ncbi:gas vesicle protein GvpG [Streptomyces sp. NBC_01618]|uniref:gas vesicle protein GvpG n=1 Tax=Streptomyces sp. NBC_01618 TaxID=2975900 RepID=UPI0038706605|nr:gas vesicle protein GvpG [Streptomyces sp. NBC_01618]